MDEYLAVIVGTNNDLTELNARLTEGYSISRDYRLTDGSILFQLYRYQRDAIRNVRFTSENEQASNSSLVGTFTGFVTERE